MSSFTSDSSAFFCFGVILGAALIMGLVGFGPEIYQFRKKVHESRRRAEEYEESWFV